LKSGTFLEDLQGEIEVTTYSKSSNGNHSSSTNRDENDQSQLSQQQMEEQQMTSSAWTSTTTRTPFLFLSLEIPPCPLFRDSQGGAIIPQIPIFEILKKYDGETLTDHISAATGHVRKKYKVIRLPKYLILHLDR
jgi:U4/U6.U5 tri-snRNP-associated protein 2